MRPPPITRQRCLEQARAARDAAAGAGDARQREHFLHVAVAYEALATKSR